jgi:hypothetical protein
MRSAPPPDPSSLLPSLLRGDPSTLRLSGRSTRRHTGNFIMGASGMRDLFANILGGIIGILV